MRKISFKNLKRNKTSCLGYTLKRKIKLGELRGHNTVMVNPIPYVKSAARMFAKDTY